MEKNFRSKALEANLPLTRQDTVSFPEAHRSFLALSEKHSGIHQRTEEFLRELHHPYSNYKVLDDALRRISMGDFWLYSSQNDEGRAVNMLATFYDEILSRPLRAEDALLITGSLASFAALTDPVSFPDACRQIVQTLRRQLETSEVTVFPHSGLLRKSFFRHEVSALGADFEDFFRLLCVKHTNYWAQTTDTHTWFGNETGKHGPLPEELKEKTGPAFFREIHQKISESKTYEALRDSIPLYPELTDYFRDLIFSVENLSDRFRYIVFLLGTESMRPVRDRLLGDLNELLDRLLKSLPVSQAAELLEEIFALLDRLSNTQTSTVLDCIRTLGSSVAATDHRKLQQLFERKTAAFRFITPGLQYITEEWRISINPYHLKNIRTWLELYTEAPQKFSRLPAALIINLKLGGVFIFDNDLFQKDISRLLNADIGKHYKLIKQLCRLFPVYFNEIGAEGELRDVTTRIDELTHRADRLIHFLRKQVHIESNNTHIGLARAIFMHWAGAGRESLKGLLPPDVMNSIDDESPALRSMRSLISEVTLLAQSDTEALLQLQPARLEKWIDAAKTQEASDKERLKLLFRLLHLLSEKYSFSPGNVIHALQRNQLFEAQDVELLSSLLQQKKKEQALRIIYKFMDRLNALILSPEKTEGWENIYHKRHIAFGIPSMYGEYHEPRFGAMGLIFRLEQVASRLLEEIEGELNLKYITAKSLGKISRILGLYRQGMKLDGISSPAFESNLQMFTYSLQSRSFSLQQHVNLFRFLGESIREIIGKYFFRPYDELLRIIIPNHSDFIGMDEKARNQTIHRRSEEFYREMLSSAFLLQGLDRFVAQVLEAMRNMVDHQPAEVLREIMSYNPDLAVSPLYAKTPQIDNQVFLGSKAYFLKKLYSLGFPVPPGFVITTEVFRRRETILSQAPLSREFDSMVRSQLRRLERMSGRQLGNASNPLLLSVRSGTAISMPGAMNTFLNVGINDEIIEKLSRQPNYGWTSWDSYRRFLQSWGMSSGISRDEFDQVMIFFKARYNVKQKVQFTPAQMREMAYCYKDILNLRRIYIEKDPYLQLRQSISLVFESWSSERAGIYRRLLQIADDWGTAVIVQQMVLGNINYTSGTGVVFTRDPGSEKPGVHLYGDYSLVSQGEDIVGGLVHVLPVSSGQKQPSGTSLEAAFPAIYQKLRRMAADIVEKHGFGHQEIEFTFESDQAEDLYILQTRNQDINTRESVSLFDSRETDMVLLGQGVGIGDGALNGLLAFDMEDMERLRREKPGSGLILVRPDTVPDDIGLIFECDGLVTSRGGATSHAAVTAARLGKICLVNCTSLVVFEKEKKAEIAGKLLFSGDAIAIDGITGSLYEGNYPVIRKSIAGD